PISNYAFRNNGNLTFTDAAAEWGLNCPGFSNGSAYGDLDNDGDLDLVVNNVNMAPFVLRNNSESILSDHHFLSMKFSSLDKIKRFSKTTASFFKCICSEFYQCR